jgi:DNA polymerase-3 subunit epsilon
VGLLNRLFKDKVAPALLRSPLPAAPLATAPTMPMPFEARRPAGRGFAVVDVETTGLSAQSHRVVELAILRTDERGFVLDEWSCRFHPDGPVGATHIHGISDADVAHAPRFPELLDEVTARLTGVAVAGHNVRFDLAFLRAEYARAGWHMPFLPSLCTLDASWVYLPRLDRRRLADCCQASGIRLEHAHSALGDARATATLLQSYLDPRFGVPPHPEHCALPDQALAVQWPTAPGGVRPPLAELPTRVQRKISATKQTSPSLLALLERFRLADALDDGAPEGSLAYLELLAEVLEDGVLSDEEQAALGELAALYELDAHAVAAAHQGFLLALAHLALDDGKVSRAEKAELTTVAGLLGTPSALLTHLLDRAEAAREMRLSAQLQPLPENWPHGDPLLVGDKVAFTGCDDALRDRLEQRAESLGVRVMNNVSARTAMLVTDGRFSGGKLADAQALGTRTVTPEVFATLLQYLQPSVRERKAAIPVQRPSTRPADGPGEPNDQPVAARDAAPTAAGVSPAQVRAWAREQGIVVGERGRMPAEIFDAYRAAHG